MPKRIQLKPHLTESELYARYNSSMYSRTERDRYHALWLLSRGKKSEEVADVTRFAVQGVRDLVKRYNHGGPDSIIDRRLR